MDDNLNFSVKRIKEMFNYFIKEKGGKNNIGFCTELQSLKSLKIKRRIILYHRLKSP